MLVRMRAPVGAMIEIVGESTANSRFVLAINIIILWGDGSVLIITLARRFFFA
jgi:hypothetical protein